jgi:polysaccharide biosynthesis protein PslJ
VREQIAAADDSSAARAASPASRRRRGWAVVLTLLALVIMWVPIRRYSFGGTSAFALEPYRVVLVVMVVGTAVVLLSRTIRWRPIAFGVPLACMVSGLLLSIVVAMPRLAAEGLLISSFGGLINLLFVLSAFVIVRQAVTDEHRALFLLKVLVFSGVVVSVGAVLERVTRFNVFLQLQRFLPVQLIHDQSESLRSGAARAYASSQHPIALAVMLCLLLPLAVYLMRYSNWPRNLYSRRFVFGVVIVLLLLGVLAAISRTGFVVLGTMLLMVLVLMPRVGLVIVSLAIPVLVVAMVVVPGFVAQTLGQFLNVKELIASQYTSAGMRGAGRLADLGPTFAQIQQHPFFGLGFSSRIVNGPEANGSILDNQVLSILLETGVVGLAGFLIFFLVPPMLLLRYAFTKGLPQQYTSLAFAVAVSGAGYFVAMFFYDAFGFMQTLFVLGFQLAIGGWLLTTRPPAKAWIERSDDPHAASSLISVGRA